VQRAAIEHDRCVVARLRRMAKTSGETVFLFVFVLSVNELNCNVMQKGIMRRIRTRGTLLRVQGK